MELPPGEDTRIPFGNFAFHVAFDKSEFAPVAGVKPEVLGGFSEITGLEASMEHKVIKEGGRNYGPAMRTGPVSFGTVVMKRGIVRSRHLWRWWSIFAGADGASDGRPLPDNRCDVLIGLISSIGGVKSAIDLSTFNADKAKSFATDTVKIRLAWRLRNAMPIKFRIGDFNAKGNDVAIEEIHLVHEGLEMEPVAL